MINVKRLRGGGLLAALAIAAILAGWFVVRATDADAATRARVVTTAQNGQLGKTVLVTRRGLTLYSLSVERRGKFICTDSACLAFWIPLVVSKSTIPTGVAALGKIRRPDGRVQVTYRGAPLYTFYLDSKRGDVGGEGFKDVGVWHAALLKKKT
jgi:predicted lipoprotein with Yx(FWY)xxD motif